MAEPTSQPTRPNATHGTVIGETPMNHNLALVVHADSLAQNERQYLIGWNFGYYDTAGNWVTHLVTSDSRGNWVDHGEVHDVQS